MLTLAAGLLLATGRAGAQQEPPEPAADVELPEGVTAEMVATGRTLFAGRGSCFACHGRSAEGTPLAPNLTDAEWLHIGDGGVPAIAELITTGVAQPKEHPAPMPPMGGAQLTESEVRALAAYLYALAESAAGG